MTPCKTFLGQAGSIVAVYCVPLLHAITRLFSKYFQILYICPNLQIFCPFSWKIVPTPLVFSIGPIKWKTVQSSLTQICVKNLFQLILSEALIKSEKINNPECWCLIFWRFQSYRIGTLAWNSWNQLTLFDWFVISSIKIAIFAIFYSIFK